MKDKKVLSLIIVMLFLIPIGISSRITSMSSITKTTGAPKTQSSETTFTYGTGSGPIDTDPANAWDPASDDVIQQIVEQLYQYNMSDPNLPIIPWLASAMPSITYNGTQYTIPLRTGITFSDGLAFNATAVKLSFDRLQKIIDNNLCQFYTLYEPFVPTSFTPVINETIANANNSVTFVLNYQYSPFLALLTFTGSSILSPVITNNSYYWTHFMEPGTWQTQAPIGTGPFILESYTAGDQVVFNANPTYWGGPDGCFTTHINTLIFKIYSSTDATNKALLNGSVQMIYPDPNYYAQLNASSNINLVEGPLNTGIEYLGMNVENIPLAIREAASYAFNYSYALQNIYNNSMAPMTSIIPKGMEYYENNLTLPYTNIINARDIILSDAANLSLSSRADWQWIQDPTNNTAWDNIIDSSNGPIAIYNYTYANFTSSSATTNMNLGTAFAYDMSQIGIDITVDGLNTSDYINNIFINSPDSFKNLEFFNWGWGADYNDPSDYINSLFLLTPISTDLSMVNDSQVNVWASNALLTTNSAQRQQDYYNIQQKIVEQLHPWILIGQGKNYIAFEHGVSGFPMNEMCYNYFAPVSYTPTLTSSSPKNPNALGGNGYVFLTWGAPTGVNQVNITGYRIYRGTSSGNEVILKNVGKVYDYNDTNVQNNQTYYYEISAIYNGGTIGPKSTVVSATPHISTSPNSNSTSSSNSTLNSNSNKNIPGYNLLILSLTIFVSIGVISVLTKKKHPKILT